jgi:hypothetical protein
LATIRGSHYHLLRPNNLLKWLTEICKHLHLPVYYKGHCKIANQQPKEGRKFSEIRNFCPVEFGKGHLPGIWIHFANIEVPRMPSFKDFMELS